ncbi:MAG: hypothetical protein ACLUW6_03810 [Coriobacteriaceae bacterium]
MLKQKIEAVRGVDDGEADDLARCFPASISSPPRTTSERRHPHGSAGDGGRHGGDRRERPAGG